MEDFTGLGPVVFPFPLKGFPRKNSVSWLWVVSTLFFFYFKYWVLCFASLFEIPIEFSQREKKKIIPLCWINWLFFLTEAEFEFITQLPFHVLDGCILDYSNSPHVKMVFFKKEIDTFMTFITFSFLYLKVIIFFIQVEGKKKKIEEIQK